MSTAFFVLNRIPFHIYKIDRRLIYTFITGTWKFNTVRVDTWPEFSIYNNNNPDLDGIVSAFTAKKVVVMIEDHNFIGRYPNAAELDTLTKWWVNIATKYKSNSYVWFNIMNEPGSPARCRSTG